MPWFIDLIKKLFLKRKKILGKRRRTKLARTLSRSKSHKKARVRKRIRTASKPHPKNKFKPKKNSSRRSSEKLRVGEITHFFSKIRVGVVKVVGSNIKVGDRILIIGRKNSFNQKVISLQIESRDVSVAKKGQLVGLKLDKPATVGDKIFTV